MSLARCADRRALEVRAELLMRTREFFADRGVLEVDTPALSVAAASDPALHSLATEVESLGARHYLQTSPELAMKRLLADGIGDIYQICRVFRDDELGRWHQPEFMMLEWYRVGFSMQDLMREVEMLLTELLRPHRPLDSIVISSYAALFGDAFGIDPHGDCAGLDAQIRAAGIRLDARLRRDALLDLALGTIVAPSFAPRQLTFVYDYPASQAALARIRGGEPPVAERFEAFVGPLEIANGFRELSDPDEQRRRFEADNSIREKLGLPATVIDEAFLGCLQRGLPDCAGVAVGFDRLVALAIGADDVAQGSSFAHRREVKTT